MADHVITGVGAEGSPYIPPIVDEEYDNYSWIIWTKPESQGGIVVSSNFVVKFARSIDMTATTVDNFKLLRITSSSPLVTQEVVSPWEDINLEEDFDSIARELVLRLENNLVASEEYLFVITGLKDSTGSIMVEDHVVYFYTSALGNEYDVDTTFDRDQIQIENYTLVQPAPLYSTQLGTPLVTCSIANGTRGVTATSFTLAYTAAITTSLITVNEENLDTGAITLLTPTVVQDPNTFLVTVTLDAAPVANCLYVVDAIYATFQFFGTLTPFYSPLSDFIIYTNEPSADPVLWTRMVFIMSKEVKTEMGENYATYELEKLDAIRNYVKYRILAMFCGQSTNDSFMLGELQVTTGIRSDVDYSALMKQWETALFGFSNVVRTADVMGPRANGPTHETGSMKRLLEREYGTFDKRLF